MQKITFDTELLAEPIMQDTTNLRLYLGLFKHGFTGEFLSRNVICIRVGCKALAREQKMTVRQVRYRLDVFKKAQLIIPIADSDKNIKLSLNKKCDKKCDKNMEKTSDKNLEKISDKKCQLFILRDQPLIHSIKTDKNNVTKNVKNYVTKNSKNNVTKNVTNTSNQNKPNESKTDMTNENFCQKVKKKERTKEIKNSFNSHKGNIKREYIISNNKKNIYANTNIDTNNIYNKGQQSNITYLKSGRGNGVALDGTPARPINGVQPTEIPAEYQGKFESIQEYLNWLYQ